MLSYIMSGLAVTKTVERILQLKRSPRELCHVDTQHQQRLDMPCLISLFKSKVQCCWVQILLSSSRFEWAHVDLHSKYSYHAAQHQAAQMTVYVACWRKAYAGPGGGLHITELIEFVLVQGSTSVCAGGSRALSRTSWRKQLTWQCTEGKCALRAAKLQAQLSICDHVLGCFWVQRFLSWRH